jgi:methylisocitrate lyase
VWTRRPTEVLYSTTTPTQKRRLLRSLLAAPGPLVLPGAFSPLTARLIEQRGGSAVYVSGHMLAADLGLPDLGLTTATEVAQRAQQIARMTDLPTVVDADTGFGEPLNAARTVQTLEDAGAAGCHIEDQVNPKRCGHSEGVEVVDAGTGARRIRAAVSARRDLEFVLIARTDARGPLGLDAAIERAQAYVDAGADVVMADALQGPEEYRKFRRAVDAPLLANLNEFGKGEPLTVAEAAEVGIDMVIYPMTLMRSAMGAAQRCLDTVLTRGSQVSAMGEMQSKDELYELIGYDSYAAFDAEVLGLR